MPSPTSHRVNGLGKDRWGCPQGEFFVCHHPVGKSLLPGKPLSRNFLRLCPL